MHSEEGDGTSEESFPLHFPVCTPTHAFTSSATCHRHTRPSTWRLCPTKDASTSSTHSPQEAGVLRKPPPPPPSLPVIPEASFGPRGRFCALTERVKSPDSNVSFKLQSSCMNLNSSRPRGDEEPGWGQPHWKSFVWTGAVVIGVGLFDLVRLGFYSLSWQM